MRGRERECDSKSEDREAEAESLSGLLSIDTAAGPACSSRSVGVREAKRRRRGDVGVALSVFLSPSLPPPLPPSLPLLSLLHTHTHLPVTMPSSHADSRRYLDGHCSSKCLSIRLHGHDHGDARHSMAARPATRSLSGSYICAACCLGLAGDEDTSAQSALRGDHDI